MEITDEIISRIMTLEDVEDLGAMSGGGSGMSMLSGGSDNTASIYITLKEDKKESNEEIGKKIEEMASDLDCTMTVSTSSMDMSALGGSGIQIDIKGRELDTLQEIAKDVAEIVSNVK